MLRHMYVSKNFTPAAITALLLLALVGPVTSLLRVQPIGVPAGSLPGANLGSLPLSFELNAGQASDAVRFMVRVPQGKLFFTPSEVAIGLSVPDSAGDGARTTVQGATFVHLSFLGANSAPQMVAGSLLPGKVNYLLGNDPQRWHTDVSTYGDISYKSLYPGIDLAYTGSLGQLKGTYTVAPGANPLAIRWSYGGAGQSSVDSGGNLHIALPASGGSSAVTQEIIEHAPTAWQEIGGARVPVVSGYAPGAGGTVGFMVGAYDPTHALTIDPAITLPYSTYLGGTGTDAGHSIAVDASGNAYVVGDTISTNFPTRNQYQLDMLGRDVFVAKINTNASGDPSLVYSTYLGGTTGSPADDFGNGIAVVNGEAYVTGYTLSSDFPVLHQYQGDQTSADAFITRLSASGSSLVYSTYVGGSSSESGSAIVADAQGNAFITGQTFSTNFPTRGQYQLDQPGQDSFVTRINTNGTGDASLIYSTYLGGGDIDVGYGIATDGASNAFVGGQTTSTNFPVLNQYQTVQALGDGFVTRINTAATGTSSLVYSTYLGGSDLDGVNAIGIDTLGNAYVTGRSDSNDYPLRNQYQGNLDPATDVFVTKLNTLGAGDSSLIYSTLICGNGYDIGSGIAVLGGDAYVVGQTGSNNFPSRNQYQGDAAGYDAFALKVNTLVSGDPSLVYSTYLGGSGDDFGYGIAVDPSGNAYVTGETLSTNFPVNNQYQTDQGTNDAFVAKLVEPPAATPTATATSTSTATPSATSTRTAVPPTSTYTSTATNIPPTATATSTATRTNTATATSTNTAVPPSSTSTRTNTPVPPTMTSTSTRTNTAVPPTATPTRTSTLAPTQTVGGASATPIPPSSTPLPPTATFTATHTNTAVPPTATATMTSTPVPPTATFTPTVTYTATHTNTPLPTQTQGGASATPVPPSSTPVLPTVTRTSTRTNTAVPSTSTSTRTNTVQPTQTASGATATYVPSSTPQTPTETIVVSATATSCAITFTDVPEGSTFYPFVRCLACRGIISGYADGSFRPGNDVTRGQLSKIVSNAAGFSEIPTGQTFEDVPVGSSFYLFIERMSSRGIIGGYACGGANEPCNPPDNRPYFRSNANATRGQISKIVSNAAGYNDTVADQLFEDVPTTNGFYVWVQRLASRGIMGGYNCGGPNEPCVGPDNRPYFRPFANATRGQVAKIVANTFFPDCQTP